MNPMHIQVRTRLISRIYLDLDSLELYPILLAVLYSTVPRVLPTKLSQASHS
jgi:hypothetical protein